MELIVLVGVSVAIVVGLVGTIISPLPGVPLIWTAVLVWASVEQTSAGWIVFAAASALAVANYVLQHRMSGGRAGELTLSGPSVLAGLVVGLAGYLAVKSLGAIAGFVGTVYLIERRRLRKQGVRRPPVAARRARPVECVTGLLVAAAWLAAVVG